LASSAGDPTDQIWPVPLETWWLDSRIGWVSRSRVVVELLEGAMRAENVVPRVPDACSWRNVIEKTTLRTSL
jgi:hypothetical protein